MAKKSKGKTRVATYIESDILVWLQQESLRLRTNASALIRQILADKMDSLDD